MGRVLTPSNRVNPLGYQSWLPIPNIATSTNLNLGSNTHEGNDVELSSESLLFQARCSRSTTRPLPLMLAENLGRIYSATLQGTIHFPEYPNLAFTCVNTSQMPFESVVTSCPLTKLVDIAMAGLNILGPPLLRFNRNSLPETTSSGWHGDAARHHRGRAT